MRRLLFLLPLVAVLSFSSCSKLEVPAGTPSCVKKKIRKMQKDMTSNETVTVQKWTHAGKSYYYFASDKCCDMMSELYDENCKLVCHPDGGISGGGDGKCPDFSNGPIAIETIWENK